MEALNTIESRNTAIELLNTQLSVLKSIQDLNYPEQAAINALIKDIESQFQYISKRHEWLFNFESGGWNSEYAHTKEEAIQMASVKYTSEHCIPDPNTFRISTPADQKSLLSLFY